MNNTTGNTGKPTMGSGNQPTKSMTPEELMKANQAKIAEQEATTAPTQVTGTNVSETPRAVLDAGGPKEGEIFTKGENTHKYQLPSAPCTLQLRGGNKVCLEGVYETSDPDEIKELDKMAESGAISRWYSGPKSTQQTPPVPPRQQLDTGGVVR